MQIAQGRSAEQLGSTITAAGGQTEFPKTFFYKLASILKQSQKAVVPAH